MYLLPVSNASLDYQPTLVKFYKKHGINEKCFKQLLNTISSPELPLDSKEDNGKGQKEQLEEPIEETVHSGNENDQLLLDF